tara:strand:+ start:2639 stop:4381 length:1743 start_codon:yes stop_codon:yes gene_type:complete
MKNTLFCLFICLNVLVVKAQTPPNVILIMTDDQGYGDISSHGNLKIKTPNMDKIANEGARLDNFFVSSVCAPTRASLLTGRYHIRTGVVSVSKNLDVMRSEEVTIAEIFKKNGYKTALFGKWHNGYHYPNTPNGQGFDEFLGFCGGHFPNYFNPTLEHNGASIETKGFITDILTDKALDWIKENKDDPFFCYIPYNAPHTPYQVPDSYFEKFSKKGFDVKTATLYGMIENLDDNIGSVLKTMSDLGLDDNTILVFMTDNGPNTASRYNAGMKGYKAQVDEGGERVPFFIRWKDKIPAGLLSSQISAHIDVLPTLVDICDLSLPKNLKLDGVSLKKTIFNDQEPFFDRMLFSHRYNGNKLQLMRGAVRTQQYRYILDTKEVGLFDMVNDPGQEVNIKKKNPKEYEELKKAYSEWFTDITKDWKLEAIIPCGYNEFPIAKLSVVEADFSGDLRFHGRGFANDWLENWVNPNDSITWDVNLVSSGRYKFTIEYQCPQDDLGSEVVVSVGGKTLKNTIEKVFDKPLYPSLDRAKRAGELQKPWGKMVLGTLKLKKGQTQVVVKSGMMKGSQVMEVKSVIVEKMR